MKKLFTLFFTLCIITLSFAQTTISGTVGDGKKEKLPGANVILKDTYDGTTTDANGNFSFTTDETGTQILVVTFIGYENYSDTIQLNKAPLNFNIALKEMFNELNAVVISAGAFEASDEKKNTILKPLDIVTTAGAEGDIYGALETLPGASKVGNDDGLYVRGGSDYETKTIIDGMPVNNPYFSTVPDVPSRGRFQPFMFKGTVFSTGGYSAEYGQALSSAVILNTEDMPDYTSSGISFAPIFLGAFHTQKFNDGKTAIGGGINYTNLRLFDNVFKPTTFDWIKSVEAADGSLFFRQKTSKTGLLKVYFQKETSNFSLRTPDIDSLPLTDDIELGNNYNYLNVTWRELLTDKWGVTAGVSYSKNNDAIIIDGFDVSRADQSYQAKITFNNEITKKIKLHYGGEYQNQHYEQNAGILNFGIDDDYFASFVESDIFITNDLAGRIGVRGEYSAALGEFNLAPRVSLAYKTSKNSQVSFAYGDFYQTPQPNYLYTTPINPLIYEKATHYILNYQYITNDRTFRIEGYYKDYDNLITQDSFNIDNFYFDYSNSGYGYARGLDLFFRDKKSIKYVDYWISYSLLDTKRKFSDYPEEVTPTFAAQNILSLVYKQYIPAINTQVGATYRYISGWPYYNPNNTQFLGDVSPALHNLAINASVLTSLWGNFTVFFLSWDNVLQFDQIYGYQYSNINDNIIVSQAPIKSTIFFGVFISILYGDDRRVNDIDIDKSAE